MNAARRAGFARREMAALLSIALLIGCGFGSEPSESVEVAPPVLAPARCESLRRTSPPERRNVVFVLADTLRRDRLGIHGGPAATPSWDRFASESIVFTAASTQAPWTKPSIATLFTGQLPSRHGVVHHPGLARGRAGDRAVESDTLAEDAVTLAEALNSGGYTTAAFVSNPWLQRSLGFGQGFEVYDDSFANNETSGEVVTRAGIDWLESRTEDGRPFFLYLHYMDSHAPYRPVGAEALERHRPEIEADRRPVTPPVRAAIEKLARSSSGAPLVQEGVPANLALLELVYDQGVEQFDRMFGELLEELRRLDPQREWAIVVTSDHGEALLERGWIEHGHGLFEDEVAVPLAMWLPGVEADAPVSCVVGLVDLRQTLCDYVGLDCPGDDQGRSLLATDLADPEHSLLIEGVVGRPRSRALRDSRWKLMVNPMPGQGGPRGRRGVVSLFDLESDPGEQRDLAREFDPGPDARSALERLRSDLADRPLAVREPSTPRVLLDRATRERLEELGYLEPEEEAHEAP